MNKALVYRRIRGGRIKISDDVLNKIEKYIQYRDEDPEAGGVLLGRYVVGTKDVVVDFITPPTKYDTRRRCYFYKDRRVHQRIITQKWKRSNGSCNLIGEWHTHPEDFPNPSLYDMSEWRRLLKETVFEDDYLFFLIAGIKEIRIWEGDKHSGEIKQLQKVGEND